jgi:hypothetical protein
LQGCPLFFQHITGMPFIFLSYDSNKWRIFRENRELSASWPWIWGWTHATRQLFHIIKSIPYMTFSLFLKIRQCHHILRAL